MQCLRTNNSYAQCSTASEPMVSSSDGLSAGGTACGLASALLAQLALLEETIRSSVDEVGTLGAQAAAQMEGELQSEATSLGSGVLECTRGLSCDVGHVRLTA
ncbi:MAG: hypothetical protein SGPRY_005592 [Prymnesium sp.]